MAQTITILFIGDIIGKAGFEAVQAQLKPLLEKHAVTFCVANGENTTDGKGLSEEDSKKLFGLGIHVITGGNHTWDRWDSRKVLGSNRNILRPLNYPRENGGNGYVIYELPGGIKAGVINIQGRTFMYPLDDPFRAVEHAIAKIHEQTKIVFIDFHAEATAEKMAMGWFVDGRASVLVGTHTHTPTADGRILPRGTGYITDVGMTGPYDSVMGMKKEPALQRFLKQTPHKYEPATNDVHFCGIIAEVDVQTGRTVRFEQILTPKF